MALQKDLDGASVMPPPPQRPRRPAVVMDEDEFTGHLEAIIERDFFPDLPKLKNKLEWLEAANSGDPRRIVEAQRNIAMRSQMRMPTGFAAATPMATPTGPGATPSGFSTPGATPGATPSIHHAAAASAPSAPAPYVAVAGAPDMGVDKFLNRYTSEDNASFASLLAADNAKVEQRREALAASEGKLPAQRLALAATRPCDGYGTTGQPTAGLVGWKHDEKEARSFFQAQSKESLPLSDADLELRAVGAPKAIEKSNTRFVAPQVAASPSGATPELHAMLRTPLVTAGGIIQQQPGGTPGRGGYRSVATPSPAPGVNESPFMTWGDIGSTPLRLEAEETPIEIGGGRFRVNQVPARELVNRRLTSTPKSGGLGARGGVAKTPTRGGGGGLTPSRAGGGGALPPSTTPGKVPLSPALQMMVAKARQKSRTSGGGGGDFGMGLRASYSGTPTRATAAPSPSPRRPPSASTPLGTPARGGGGGGGGGGGAAAITDGLLDL